MQTAINIIFSSFSDLYHNLLENDRPSHFKASLASVALLHQFPKEIFEHIYTHLSIPQLNAYARVCKSFNADTQKTLNMGKAVFSYLRPILMPRYATADEALYRKNVEEFEIPIGIMIDKAAIICTPNPKKGTSDIIVSQQWATSVVYIFMSQKCNKIFYPQRISLKIRENLPVAKKQFMQHLADFISDFIEHQRPFLW